MKKVLLMGKSGSGKTSMLNIIFGHLTKKDTELLDTTSDIIKTGVDDIAIEEDMNSYDNASKLSDIILDCNIAKSAVLLEQNEISNIIVDNNVTEDSILINDFGGNISNVIVNNSPDKDPHLLNLTSGTSDIILDNKATEDTTVTRVYEQALRNADDNISNDIVNNSQDKNQDILNLISSTSDIILDNKVTEDTAVTHIYEQALKNSDDNISNVIVNNSPDKDLDILNLTSSTSNIVLDNKATEDTIVTHVYEQALKNSDDNISNDFVSNSQDKNQDILNLISSTSDIILDNKATVDTAVTHVYKQILRNLIIDIWDCKDYEVLEEIVQQDILFSNVEILIYVFDIKCDDEDLRKIYKDYQICGNLVHTYSSSALIFVLIHKSDLILCNQKDTLFLECENNMTKILKLEKCFITSIFDQSLYEAWSSIVKYLIPSIEDVDESLVMLGNTIECNAIFLFDCPTFLNIYSNISPTNDTDFRYNEVLTIIRRFQLKCKNLGPKFVNWQVCNKYFSVLLESFTPDSYVIVVTNEPQIYDVDQISSFIKSAGADFWELRNADQNDLGSLFRLFEV